MVNVRAEAREAVRTEHDSEPHARLALLVPLAAVLLACAVTTPAPRQSKSHAPVEAQSASSSPPSAVLVPTASAPPADSAPPARVADSVPPAPSEALLDPADLLEEGSAVFLHLFERPEMRFGKRTISGDPALVEELERRAVKRVLVITDSVVPEARRAEVVELLRKHGVRDIGLVVVAPLGSPAAGPERLKRPDGVPASIAGGNWACGFPKKADEDKVDEGFVTLRIRVGSDGRAVQATTLHHSGHGFAAAATACALSKRYRPALDANGNPVEGDTVPIHVRFAR